MSGDAFGAALLDHLHGRPEGELLLEVDDGYVTPAMPALAFFLPAEAWSAEEREVLGHANAGPVLDLGAGAGRHTLHFRALGHAVTAVDSSPGAVDVCKVRGVVDVRLADLTDPPTDKQWATVLLMCGNFGLAGGWDETRALLRRLADVSAKHAVLIADTVDPTLMEDEHSVAHRARNVAMGAHVGRVRLRLRYGAVESAWWNLLNVPIADVTPLVADTGWTLETHLVASVDHYLVLRRA